MNLNSLSSLMFSERNSRVWFSPYDVNHLPIRYQTFPFERTWLTLSTYWMLGSRSRFKPRLTANIPIKRAFVPINRLVVFVQLPFLKRTKHWPSQILPTYLGIPFECTKLMKDPKNEIHWFNMAGSRRNPKPSLSIPIAYNPRKRSSKQGTKRGELLLFLSIPAPGLSGWPRVQPRGKCTWGEGLDEDIN